MLKKTVIFRNVCKFVCNLSLLYFKNITVNFFRARKVNKEQRWNVGIAQTFRFNEIALRLLAYLFDFAITY